MYYAMRRYAMTAVVCLLAGATTAQAQGLPDVPTGTVLNEVMMDAQGSEALLYGALLGVSPTSPQSLSGTSLIDPSGGSFSFSLNPGSTYLGQSISDSVQGQFDPTTSSYLWSARGSWGNPFEWVINGKIVPIEIDPTKPTWQLTSSETLTIQGVGDLQLPDTATVYGSGMNGPTLSVLSSSLLDPFGRQFGQRTGIDTYDPATNTYVFQDLFIPKPQFPLVLFQDRTTGVSPFTGGAGTYTTTIGAVPEPSTLLMLPLGLLGMIAYAWWTRQSAGARVPTQAGA